MKSKSFEIVIIICYLLVAFFIGMNLISCKSVNKSQSAKRETATVKKVDNSEAKSYTVIDTTKTDSSTEITTSVVTIDSFEYVGHGDVMDIINPTPIFVGNNHITATGTLTLTKARGIKIISTTKKQAATVDKGLTSQIVISKNVITVDSTGVKDETNKVVTKEVKPFKSALTIALTILFLGIAGYGFWMVYKSRKKIISKVIT